MQLAELRRSLEEERARRDLLLSSVGSLEDELQGTQQRARARMEERSKREQEERLRRVQGVHQEIDGLLHSTRTAASTPPPQRVVPTPTQEVCLPPDTSATLWIEEDTPEPTAEPVPTPTPAVRHADPGPTPGGSSTGSGSGSGSSGVDRDLLRARAMRILQQRGGIPRKAASPRGQSDSGGSVRSASTSASPGPQDTPTPGSARLQAVEPSAAPHVQRDTATSATTAARRQNTAPHAAARRTASASGRGTATTAAASPAGVVPHTQRPVHPARWGGAEPRRRTPSRGERGRQPAAAAPAPQRRQTPQRRGASAAGSSGLRSHSAHSNTSARSRGRGGGAGGAVFYTASQPTAAERRRASQGYKALAQARSQSQRQRVEKTQGLLQKAKVRVDAFCAKEGIGDMEQDRERARQEIVARRAHQAKLEREKRDQAEQLRHQFLMRQKEADRQSYLRDLHSRHRNHSVQSVPLKPPGASRLSSAGQPHHAFVSRGLRGGNARVSRQPQPRHPDTSHAEVTYDDVDRVAVNLFDSTILSEPTSPGRGDEAGEL